MVYRFLFLPALSATCLLATPGAQVGRSLKIDEKTNVSYLRYLPQDFHKLKKWTLLLFLHGRGESNGPLSGLKK
tara:strand:+ start:393 stop:614 length:222 start_codon:yes stop_codon:yes gene_type:complete